MALPRGYLEKKVLGLSVPLVLFPGPSPVLSAGSVCPLNLNSLRTMECLQRSSDSQCWTAMNSRHVI